MNQGLVLLSLLPVVLTFGYGADSEEPPELEGLPVCSLEVSSGDLQDWKKVVAPNQDVQFELPSDFESVPETDNFFIHGGQRWESETSTLTIAYGYWGRSSFSDWESACRLEVGELPAVAMTSSDKEMPKVVVWFRTPGPGHEPVFTINSRDSALGWGILRSVSLLSEIGESGTP